MLPLTLLPLACVGMGTVPPQQIHLSLTGLRGEMVVDWVADVTPGSAVCQVSPMPYGGEPLTDAECLQLNRTGNPVTGFGCCGCAPNSKIPRGWSACVWEENEGKCRSMVTEIPARVIGHSSDMGESVKNYSLLSAVMRNLTCGQQYFYRLGSHADNVWTDEPPQIGFFALCDEGFGGRQPIWAAYGDLGLDVDQYRDMAPSIPALAADLQAGKSGPGFDGVIHAGDYAYDFSVDGGSIGDQFMNAIQPYASKVPYMGAVGNHECGGSNLQHFARRFGGLTNAATNSGAKGAGSIAGADAMWFSWDAGFIHFIAINSEVWNSPMMVPEPGNGSCVWNPTTNRSLLEEFGEWLEADLKAVNSAERRQKTPWVVSFAHKAWYMQPGCNFSFIDDLAHKYGVDLHIGGHIHTYQRFFPLRMNPMGPIMNSTTHKIIPNNNPADVDFDCVSTSNDQRTGVLIENNTYTNPRYMVTIVAGSPGNHEVTPATTDADVAAGICTGSVKNPSFNEPLAACRKNYGYGKLQAMNATHLHWTWEYAGFGTPSCSTPPCDLPNPSTWPETVFHDELWLIKDKGSHGPRNYDAPNRLHPSATFVEYEPTGKETDFDFWYKSSRDEWRFDGCGEFPSDGDTSDGCEGPVTTCEIRDDIRACSDQPHW